LAVAVSEGVKARVFDHFEWKAGEIRLQKPMKQKEFKTLMPQSAAFIESMCNAFGTDVIHGQVRDGLAGAPTFHAIENGYEIGTAFLSHDGVVPQHPVTGSAIDVQALQLELAGAQLLDQDDPQAAKLRAEVRNIEWNGPIPTYRNAMTSATQAASKPKRVINTTTIPKDEKAALLAKFVDVFLIEDGNRMIVAHGDKRTGLRGKHIATISMKHSSGYEIVLQMDNGKIESFRPDQLFNEQVMAPRQAA